MFSCADNVAVGRWQKNKDLSWYAKGDDSQKAVDAANARADEIRRIKEAEQDALSEALGFKVEPRLREHQLAGPKEVEKAIKEAAEGDEEDGGKGLGFGGFAGATAGGGEEAGDRMMGYLIGEQGGLDGGAGVQIGKKEKRRKTSRSRELRRRRGSIERRGERDKRKQQDDEYGKSHQRNRSGERYHHHHRRRRHSPSRSYSRSRSRQRERERRREDDGNARRRGRRERSFSPAAAAQQQQPHLDQRRPPTYYARHQRERSYSVQESADPENRTSRSYRRERSGSPKPLDEKGYHRHRRQRSYSPKKARRRDRSREGRSRGR